MQNLHPHHWPSRGRSPDAIDLLHDRAWDPRSIEGSRRTRHAMRHDPAGPTPAEADATRADRSGLAIDLGIFAVGLLLAFMVLPAVGKLIGGAL